MGFCPPFSNVALVFQSWNWLNNDFLRGNQRFLFFTRLVDGFQVLGQRVVNQAGESWARGGNVTFKGGWEATELRLSLTR